MLIQGSCFGEYFKHQMFINIPIYFSLTLRPTAFFKVKKKLLAETSSWWKCKKKNKTNKQTKTL